MIRGAISNSWRLQLTDHDLSELVEQARNQGAEHVELRQTCLGEYETGEGDEWRPVFPKMQALVDQFPQLTFDLAMAMPCLTRHIDAKGGLFQAALAGAKMVGGDSPHLRTVDPGATGDAWQTPDDVPETAWGLVELTPGSRQSGRDSVHGELRTASFQHGHAGQRSALPAVAGGRAVPGPLP